MSPGQARPWSAAGWHGAAPPVPRPAGAPLAALAEGFRWGPTRSRAGTSCLSLSSLDGALAAEPGAATVPGLSGGGSTERALGASGGLASGSEPVFPSCGTPVTTYFFGGKGGGGFWQVGFGTWQS